MEVGPDRKLSLRPAPTAITPRINFIEIYEHVNVIADVSDETPSNSGETEVESGSERSAEREASAPPRQQKDNVSSLKSLIAGCVVGVVFLLAIWFSTKRFRSK